MKKIWIVLIVVGILVGGFFLYNNLKNSSGDSGEDFGKNMYGCSETAVLGGSFPIIGYGGGNVTGIETHDLNYVGEVELCCIDFENMEDENYKVCFKRNEEGVKTHQIAFKQDKKVYEVVPEEGLSCLYTYDDKGDWTRNCK